jgi:aminoglycoside phosphotransferase (APT) family kinase protein
MSAAAPDRPGPLLATGGSAQVYAWGAQHVLKLYLAGMPPGLPAAEAARTNAARKAGAPAPQAIETVSLSGRHGVVLERAQGPTMLEALIARPQALDALARQLATLQVALHALPGGTLPPLRERLRNRIGRADALAPAVRARLVEILEQLSAGAALCHGDFHPGNVILTERGPIVIDWYDAASGAPEADLARTLLLIRYARVPGQLDAATENLRAAFETAFARHSAALRPIDATSVRRWTIVVAAARLAEPIAPSERTGLCTLLQRELASE